MPTTRRSPQEREALKRRLKAAGAPDWNVPAIDWEDRVGEEPQWAPRPEDDGAHGRIAAGSD